MLTERFLEIYYNAAYRVGDNGIRPNNLMLEYFLFVLRNLFLLFQGKSPEQGSVAKL